MPTIDTSAFTEELDEFEGAAEALAGVLNADGYGLARAVSAAEAVRDDTAVRLAYAVLRAAIKARNR